MDYCDKHGFVTDCAGCAVATAKQANAEAENKVDGLEMGLTAWRVRAEQAENVRDQAEAECRAVKAERDSLAARLEAAERERDAHKAQYERASTWIDDLHTGMFINCVYCGHRYGPRESGATVLEAGVTMAEALRAHIETCPKHPMSALRADADRRVEAARLEEREAQYAAVRALEDMAKGLEARLGLIEEARREERERIMALDIDVTINGLETTVKLGSIAEARRALEAGPSTVEELSPGTYVDRSIRSAFADIQRPMPAPPASEATETCSLCAGGGSSCSERHCKDHRCHVCGGTGTVPKKEAGETWPCVVNLPHQGKCGECGGCLSERCTCVAALWGFTRRDCPFHGTGTVGGGAK